MMMRQGHLVSTTLLALASDTNKISRGGENNYSGANRNFINEPDGLFG